MSYINHEGLVKYDSYWMASASCACDDDYTFGIEQIFDNRANLPPRESFVAGCHPAILTSKYARRPTWLVLRLAFA